MSEGQIGGGLASGGCLAVGGKFASFPAQLSSSCARSGVDGFEGRWRADGGAETIAAWALLLHLSSSDAAACLELAISVKETTTTGSKTIIDASTSKITHVFGRDLLSVAASSVAEPA